MCNEFSGERFLDRTKKLSDTIHRKNIKTCQSIKAVKSSTTTSEKKQISGAATGHRVLEIAQARGYSIKELIKYDLIPTSYVFYEDGLMKKPVKSALCHGMEWCLNSGDMLPPSGWKSIRTKYLVNVVANVQSLVDIC